MPSQSEGTEKTSDSDMEYHPYRDKHGDLQNDDQRYAEHELEMARFVVNQQHGYQHHHTAAERREQQKHALAYSVFVPLCAAFVADRQYQRNDADNGEVNQKIIHHITEVEKFES